MPTCNDIERGAKCQYTTGRCVVPLVGGFGREVELGKIEVSPGNNVMFLGSPENACGMNGDSESLVNELKGAKTRGHVLVDHELGTGIRLPAGSYSVRASMEKCDGEPARLTRVKIVDEAPKCVPPIAYDKKTRKGTIHVTGNVLFASDPNNTCGGKEPLKRLEETLDEPDARLALVVQHELGVGFRIPDGAYPVEAKLEKCGGELSNIKEIEITIK